MRDPKGSLRFEQESAFRRLGEPLAADDFLRSGLASRWSGDGRLIPFEIAEPTLVVSPRLPFVTLPSEWCDLQLHDAGRLTLELQAEAAQQDFDLKDASAWNVLFDGARPVFCDHLSFDRLASKPWWAAGQFARHFLLPLLLSKRRGLRAGHAFRVWRDGVPPDVARSMLGASRFLSRYWPLMAAGRRSEPTLEHRAADTKVSASDEDRARLRAYRESLYASLTWMLDGVRPFASDSSTWARYESQRDHYDDVAMAAKKRIIDEWLTRLKPKWAIDLGCNAGEFSLTARDRGAQVVSIDADHDAIQRLYRRLGTSGGIFPLITPLDDLAGGRGWLAGEFPGLAERLIDRFDVVLMLALIHHLMVSAAVPVSDIAQMVHAFSNGWAIVELIDSDDIQLRRLCAQRRRDRSEFTLELQRAAFLQAGFFVEAESTLPGATRTLVLLRKA